jgi:hypothetical protein
MSVFVPASVIAAGHETTAEKLICGAMKIGFARELTARGSGIPFCA